MSCPSALLSAKSMHWPTPQKLYSKLNLEFEFDLDPCPLNQQPDDPDGLEFPWNHYRVFCNPPYGRGVDKWLMKHNEPDLAVYLLAARTDTAWFHDLVLGCATEIRFLRGRLYFGDTRGRATFPSMIVVYNNLL